MKSLLLVAHGSRRVQSNDEIREVAERVREQAGERFGFVTSAFLELADPSIPAGIDECIAAGADEVMIMPYFLSAGRHVAKDIPTIVDGHQKKHPNIPMKLATYLGASEIMPSLIVDTVDAGLCLCGKTQDACIKPACLQS